MNIALRAVLAGLLGVASIVIVLALFGHPPAAIIRALFEGSIGSRFALGETALRSIPLLLTALSVVIAFRAGVWNIGAEGQFVIGGLAAFVAGHRISNPILSIVIALLAGAAGGGAWALIASFARNRRNAPEVLTTILLNFVALHLLGFAVNGPLQESRKQYPQSELFPHALTSFGDTRLHLGVAIALIAAVGTHWLLFRTRTGLKLRAVGSSESAARWASIDVKRQIALAFALSGALAGVAGAVELLGVTHRLYERFASGYGYSGITVALLAALQPIAAIASALFIGALRAGAGELQRTASISSSIALVAEGVAIIALVTISRLRIRQRMRDLE